MSAAAACAVVGRALARDGASLGEALSGLCTTYTALAGRAPDFEATEALAVAWSEATLDYLHDVCCEDPLTGLASLPHLRSRLVEIYREAEREGGSVNRTHALVVVDGGRRGTSTAPGAVFTSALWLAALAESIRAVFPGEETIARIGSDRVAVLVRRTPALGARLESLRALLQERGVHTPRSLWIEGLPDRSALAGSLLSELAR